jgi:putative transcriptional regulator
VFRKSGIMTELGSYLSKKSVNKSDVSRKTGISKTRLSELSNNSNTKLRVDELYLIALAIDVAPGEMLNEICGYLKLELDT